MTTLNLAAILSAVATGAFAKVDAAAELTRRIDKRAAAGKHPMVHVVAARDALIETV